MIGTIVSHYRVVDRLGAGGMGVVYRGEDLRLGRHVAMKFLPESATADPLATERFQREARTTSALNHPNICTLHDVGEYEGRRFIVMELIDGATLDKVLGAGALPATALPQDARDPLPAELNLGLEFVKEGENRWSQFARALLSSNEFLFVN
jgi:non-specific serine/threonine protein kinase